MNGFSYLLLITLLDPLPARVNGPNDPVGQTCISFISRLTKQSKNAAVEFNLESALELTPEALTSAYDAIQPVGSNCAPGGIEPASPEDIMSPWQTRSYADVAAGLSGKTPWIQFVYPSINSHGQGLASSVVFYDDTGNPVATRLVSEYHGWENASALRSVMLEGRIESCRQNIEFFSHDDEGNLIKELASPARSACDYSATTYPHDHSDPDISEKDAIHGSGTESCAQVLATSVAPGDGEKLSAFNLFNKGLPSASTPTPAEMEIPVNTDSPSSTACLPPNYFDFLKFVDGELVAGTSRDVSLVSIWRLPEDHYFITYLYKAYETKDGEGSSFIISGTIADSAGRPLAVADEISSWYHYEGSVRIRDFSYSKGRFVQTEEVFDPLEVDEVGRPIRYISNGKRTMKEGHLTTDSFPIHESKF